MAARVRRVWSVLRDEIRELLRETVGAESWWGDGELLSWFNHAITLRTMQLQLRHEGWLTSVVKQNTVVGQNNYTIPEGTGHVKRVLFVISEGGDTIKVPLKRHERFNATLYEPATGSGEVDILPTYRLVGGDVVLEPAPRVARTNGLELELEFVPARLTGDGDKLDQGLPTDALEDLLVYDVWDVAMGVEDAQGNIDVEARGRLRLFHAKLEKTFGDYTETRSHGLVFSPAYYLGD